MMNCPSLIRINKQTRHLFYIVAKLLICAKIQTKCVSEVNTEYYNVDTIISIQCVL